MVNKSLMMLPPEEDICYSQVETCWDFSCVHRVLLDTYVYLFYMPLNLCSPLGDFFYRLMSIEAMYIFI